MDLHTMCMLNTLIHEIVPVTLASPTSSHHSPTAKPFPATHSPQLLPCLSRLFFGSVPAEPGQGIPQLNCTRANIKMPCLVWVVTTLQDLLVPTKSSSCIIPRSCVQTSVVLLTVLPVTYMYSTCLLCYYFFIRGGGGRREEVVNGENWRIAC